MELFLCISSGILLGLLFYGGLWLTLAMMTTARNPGLLVGASFLIRLGLVGAGMLLLTLRGVGCLGAGFLGFLLVRIILTLPDRELD